MKKGEIIFLVVNILICIITWAVLVKLFYFFGVQLYLYHSIIFPWLSFFGITILFDLLIIRILKMRRSRIIYIALVEIFLIYFVLWILVEQTSYN
jgi:hypothetical protein